MCKFISQLEIKSLSISNPFFKPVFFFRCQNQAELRVHISSHLRGISNSSVARRPQQPPPPLPSAAPAAPAAPAVRPVAPTIRPVAPTIPGKYFI